MKALFEFIQLPLSLPINPVWDFVICLILNELTYKMAFTLTGRSGVTRNERYFFHWGIRFLLFFFMWLLFCMGICIFQFVQRNLIWVVPIGAVIICTICVLYYWIKNLQQKNKKLNVERLEMQITPKKL